MPESTTETLSQAAPESASDTPSGGAAEPVTRDGTPLRHILEAALLAADEPLSKARLLSLFPEDEQPSTTDIGKALEAIATACADRGVELHEVASGFRLQVRGELQPWVARLWTEKPQKYSRAMLETLALIAYRQPITRGEIESVRGVSLSSNIIRSLQEREWIRIVGHRDVPGKPALFGTTKAFLDYFDLKSLDELPTLAEIRDMDTLEPELDFDAEPSPDADGGPAPEEEREARSDTPQDAVEARDEDGLDNDGTDGDGTDGDEDAPAPADNSLEDGPVKDEDLDEAFEELDQAFGRADDIDLGEVDVDGDGDEEDTAPGNDADEAAATDEAAPGTDRRTP